MDMGSSENNNNDGGNEAKNVRLIPADHGADEELGMDVDKQRQDGEPQMEQQQRQQQLPMLGWYHTPFMVI